VRRLLKYSVVILALTALAELRRRRLDAADRELGVSPT
jgi:hypothetical protein